MKKLLEIIRNNSNIVWGIVSLIVLGFLFFMGRKSGMTKARAKKNVVPFPDGGKSLGDWPKGTNPAGKTTVEIANDWAKKIFDVTDGAWVTHPDPSQDRRLNTFIALYTLGNDQLTAVYNQYNLNHGQKFWGWTFVSMTEAITNEWLAYGSDVQTKLVNRLKTLKLK